jgi:dTDP-L-rhamnose 4-epimerase
MSCLLVTGGAGFIGSHIVGAALAEGWSVRILDSFREDAHPAEFSERVEVPGVTVVHGDVTDPKTAEDALDGVTAVSHQAAKVGLGIDFGDAPDYTHSNLTGTAVLLAAMSKRRVDRLVLASSMVVYGEGLYELGSRRIRPTARRREDLENGRFDPLDASRKPMRPVLISEEDRLDPRNVYAATKLAQEHLASSWARATGGRVAALRYHNVFGSRMPMGTPYAGVASLFRTALERGEAPRVFEDGHQRRDFVDVRDVASANLAALAWTGSARQGAFRAFNVGSGTVHTVGEFADTLSRSFGGPAPVVTGEYRLGDVRHITASSARVREELGWTPKHEFESAVVEFARAELRRPAAAKGIR